MIGEIFFVIFFYTGYWVFYSSLCWKAFLLCEGVPHTLSFNYKRKAQEFLAKNNEVGESWSSWKHNYTLDYGILVAEVKR